MNPRRMEALSDSTFAVAMTLLIFDVRLPAAKVHTLGHDLWDGAWPHYLGYVVSFMVIGVIWINHHTIFRLARGIDHRVMVLNLALLGLVVFIPFPTQVLALYLAEGSARDTTLATAFYGLSLSAATCMLAILWHTVSRRLLHSWVGDGEVRQLTRRYYLTPLLYLVGTAVALINATAGIVVFLVVGGGYLLHTGTQAAPASPDAAIESQTRP